MFRLIISARLCANILINHTIYPHYLINCYFTKRWLKWQNNASRVKMATLFLVKYEDKYLLCNLVSSVSLLAQLTCLREFGFDLPSQQIAKAWGQCHNVSLNFETQSVCKFVSAQSNDIESPKKTIKLGNYRVNRSIVTTKEYFSWEITTDYEIFIKSAADTKRRTLLSRKIVLPVKTTENQAPVPLATEKKVKTVDITFLLNKLEENNLVFTIDRSDAKCHTPSRNCDVKALCDFHKSLAQWIYTIRGYFTDLFHHVRMEFDISVIQEQVQKIEIPFMPLLHKNNPLDDDGDINCQLKHQQNLQETLNEIQTNSNPIDFESQLLLVGEHIVKLQDSYFTAIEIIEQQLMAEFIALVGKNIPSGEFPKIINFHFRKILEKKFQPKSLCFPIRRANYHPEGYLYVNKFDKIEQKSRPISAFSKEICTKKAINISLNSTTKIELTGRKQIHTFLDYKFGDAHDPNLSLHIESNEFSAFIVLLGSMISATEFEPRHGIILKNKDFLKVPLFLETFPSAKQFKSFIHSLSPGQQEFAKALRNYQLESSLFAFCVIQIEPQLESILNLPPSSLHKEFLLTRDLIEVFGKYQFPPDLLAFDPLLSQNEPDSLKIQQVRSSFTQISEFIESQKQCALFESSLRSGRREAELIEEEVLPRNQGTRPFVNQELWQKGQNVDKSQFENLDILHIGPPSDFVHHVHVIFDPESGFSVFLPFFYPFSFVFYLHLPHFLGNACRLD